MKKGNERFRKITLGKRVLSWVLTVAFVAGSVPSSVFASGEVLEYAGESLYSEGGGELVAEEAAPEGALDAAAGREEVSGGAAGFEEALGGEALPVGDSGGEILSEGIPEDGLGGEILAEEDPSGQADPVIVDEGAAGEEGWDDGLSLEVIENGGEYTAPEAVGSGDAAAGEYAEPALEIPESAGGSAATEGFAEPDLEIPESAGGEEPAAGEIISGSSEEETAVCILKSGDTEEAFDFFAKAWNAASAKAALGEEAVLELQQDWVSDETGSFAVTPGETSADTTVGAIADTSAITLDVVAGTSAFTPEGAILMNVPVGKIVIHGNQHKIRRQGNAAAGGSIFVVEAGELSVVEAEIVSFLSRFEALRTE